MSESKYTVESIIEKIEQKRENAGSEEIDIRNIREIVIRRTLVFIDDLDTALRMKAIGSIERYSDVHRETKTLEIRLHVTVLGKSKVLKFGVHRTKIIVGGQRASDQVNPTGPIYNEDQLIQWLSNQISSMP